MRSRYEPFLIIPGREIPSWFCNQNHFNPERRKSFEWDLMVESDFVSRRTTFLPIDHDALVSIIVDIPHCCLSSEW